MIRLPPDFLDLLIALNAAEAKYLLVGGHALRDPLVFPFVLGELCET